MRPTKHWLNRIAGVGKLWGETLDGEGGKLDQAYETICKNIMSRLNSEAQIIKVRMEHAKQDLAMIEARELRLKADRKIVILKLIAQREQLLALKEQDE